MIAYNKIVAIIALIATLFGAFYAFVFSVFAPDLIINGVFAVVVAVLGVSGVFIFDRNYKIALAQYIISAIGVIIGIYLVGIPGCILFLIAGLLAYIEREKSENYSQVTPVDHSNAHYFGDQPQQVTENQYIRRDTRRYWALPAITFIIIIGLIIVSTVATMDFSNDPKVTIENMNLSRNTSSDTSYSLKCDLIPNNDYSYLQMDIEFFDSSDNLLASELAYNVNGVTKNQTIKIDQPVYTGTMSETPTYARIYIYDTVTSNKEESIYNATVYLNNTQ